MKRRKGLSNIIYVSKQGEHHVFKLYDTNILIFEDGMVKLNTNGFKTNHTKNCMNDNLPQEYKVFQKAFEWYVNTPEGIIEFKDNMKLKVV